MKKIKTLKTFKVIEFTRNVNKQLIKMKTGFTFTVKPLIRVCTLMHTYRQQCV